MERRGDDRVAEEWGLKEEVKQPDGPVAATL